MTWQGYNEGRTWQRREGNYFARVRLIVSPKGEKGCAVEVENELHRTRRKRETHLDLSIQAGMKMADAIIGDYLRQDELRKEAERLDREHRVAAAQENANA